MYGRDYFNIAPKDQLPRKISGKRTVYIKTLEREQVAPPKDSRSQVKKQLGEQSFNESRNFTY